MATALAQRTFHWPRSSINRASLDKSLPSKPPREHRDQHHGHVHSHSQPLPVRKPVDRKPTDTAPKPTTNTKSSRPERDHSMTTVLVGPQKQRFKVNKKALCASSPFFRDRLEDPKQRSVSLWLPAELPSMFAFFVDWLHIPRHSFRRHLDTIVAAAAKDRGPRGLHDVHWALIRLHLFASHLSLFHLQDCAMDALQDLYLNCDWDVPPGLLTYLYTRCDALPAVRLRRWAVAMVAFSLTGSPSARTSSTSTSTPTSITASTPISMTMAGPKAPPIKLHPEYDWGLGGPDDDGTNSISADDTVARFRQLINSIPDLADDYAVHMSKMDDSGLDVRFKNPQLRIPANRLRNDERAFGFRECSFHSHRATVGERRCPHERKRLRSLAAAAATANEEGKGGLYEDDGKGGEYAGKADVRRMLVAELMGSEAKKMQAQLEGLSSPSRRPSQREKEAEPQALFTAQQVKVVEARGYLAEDEKNMAVKHVRSVSSTLK